MKLTAAELFESVETALAITGLAHFQSADSDGQEVLKYVPGSTEDEDDCWALVPLESDTDEFVAVDTEMTMHILMSHFREWLLTRGFQIQVHCYAVLRRWTLVDVLSPSEGGGDRLDVEYPYGEDQLKVLVDSVVAVNTIS